jgi:transketolase
VAVPQLDHSRRIGSPSRGAYVLRPADGTPELCIVASGSEVSIAVAAASLLAEDGIAAGVVSMPSWELFERQSDEYRAEVLPPGVPRLVVEASSPLSLWRVAGAGGRVHAVDRFGASASPERMLQEYGFTPEAVATAARELVLAEIAEVVS